jgi:hypothetical protein
MIPIKTKGDMQDGILAWYLSQAAASDANVEERLDREPFDWREWAANWSPGRPKILNNKSATPRLRKTL